MKIDLIIKKFQRKGYSITRSISTGNIVVNTSNGSRVFNSYNAAYKYYFG